jgi:lipid II:glycine glycyltransferase (peptidoglycan interpeptide bridge formation enzyme)
MNISEASDPQAWDSFILSQPWKPFLQSWTMGEVYREVGQEPVRLIAKDGSGIKCICFGHIVPAKRGRHLSVPYGPVLDHRLSENEQGTTFRELVDSLKKIAESRGCSFIRMSPFWPSPSQPHPLTPNPVPSPLHLLAEHIWFMKLKTENKPRTGEEILAGMRKTARNLIRRAEKDGVTVEASENPVKDLQVFIDLHSETRRRHGFTPYSDAFFRSQVSLFAPRGECTLYLAKFQGEVIASSVHMHFGGETSYHHGASASKFSKIPASYLLQWTAIKDALKRSDDIYNFWGIAPPSPTPNPSPEGGGALPPLSPLGGKGSGDRGKKHPFSGVTLFKTGFGGELLNLKHCFDLPLSRKYWLTYGFELLRKWHRGF